MLTMNNQMAKVNKVIAFSASSIMGGADYILYQLVQCLAVDKVILSKNHLNNVKISECEVVFYPFRSLNKSIKSIVLFLVNYLKATAFLVKHIKSGDTIICNDFLSIVYIFPIRLLRPIRIIFYNHVAFKLTFANRIFVARYIRYCASGIVVPSNYLKGEMQKLGIRKDMITVLNNGLPDLNFISGQKNEHQRPLYIGFFGGITPQKGQDILVKAMLQLEQQSNSLFKAYIVGEVYDQMYYQSLKKIIDDNNLPVSFTGFLDYENTQQMMAEMDIVVCASKHRETFPTVLLEALRLGVPVIATNVGGIPEIVVDKCNGILIEPNDEKSLAEAIKTMITNNLMLEYGLNGKNMFLNRFTLDKYIYNAINIFEIKQREVL